MTKELSPGVYWINLLYSIKDEENPLSLNQKDKEYVWRFTFRATEKIKNKFKDTIMYLDRNSLECALQNNSNIKIKNNKIYLDKGADIETINECLDPEMKKELPEIFREVYRGL